MAVLGPLGLAAWKMSGLWVQRQLLVFSGFGDCSLQ